MDTVADNPNIIRELARLGKITAEKKNVTLVNVHSFEFALLSFEHLISWVFAEPDELKEKRADLLRARELILKMSVPGAATDTLTELKSVFPYVSNHNSEQISAELLFRITRNTGFETDKRHLGACFIRRCCEWYDRQTDDICGLDERRISADEKKKQLIEYTVLKVAFEKAGL